jgi:hypothetical protein
LQELPQSTLVVGFTELLAALADEPLSLRAAQEFPDAVNNRWHD